MIYDCFLFFSELDLLDIRLNVMDKYVDYFVLVESKKTFTFKDKPLYYEENNHLFKKFHNKIIHVVTDFETQSDWGNEFHQRECIKGALKDIADTDIVILSDLDEIPNLEGFNFDIGTEVYGFNHQYYYYYLNCKMSLTQCITKLFRAEHFKYRSAQEMRTFYPVEFIEKMGWHFSFMGGVKSIQDKMNAFAHQDINVPEYNSDDAIMSAIGEKRDLFNRDFSFEDVEIEKSFPEYIRKNQEKFKHLIK